MEFLLKHKKKLFYCKGDLTVELVVQSSYGVSSLGDTENWTGHSSEQPVLVNLALTRRLHLVIF